MMIIQQGGKPVGVLRLDTQDDHGAELVFEISILIDPALQGRGIGLAALRLVRGLVPGATLLADILPENIASQRVFEAAGYRLRSDDLYSNSPAALSCGASARGSSNSRAAQNEKTSQEIRIFWNQQAKKYGPNLIATTPDPLAKELEIKALLETLDPNLRTLEAGCGHGFNIFSIAKSFANNLVGFDYAEVMIETAKEKLKSTDFASGIEFHLANILEDLSSLGSFPQIYTDRCLINLPSLEMQITAVKNLAAILDPGGKLVLIEPVQQGQERLNSLRETVGLKPVPYHWHNLYLDEDAFLKLTPASLKHLETRNFASLYFLISRVFNAKLTPEGQDPDYLSELNKLAVQIPSFGDVGPLNRFTCCLPHGMTLSRNCTISASDNDSFSRARSIRSRSTCFVPDFASPTLERNSAIWLFFNAIRSVMIRACSSALNADRATVLICVAIGGPPNWGESVR